MKQDYLWDKSGEDAELAELENALAAFRYQETAPPALPSKILAFQPKIVEKTSAAKPPRRFSFAFAACAAAILIALGAAFQISSEQSVTGNDLAQTFSSNRESVEETRPVIQIEETDENETFSLENVETSPPIEVSKRIIKQFKKTFAEQTPKTNVVKTRQPISIENKSNVRKPEIKTSSAALTDEEKHAYDQLMLALSITSSKLKIVKDKIDGVEENAPFETKR